MHTWVFTESLICIICEITLCARKSWNKRSHGWVILYILRQGILMIRLHFEGSWPPLHCWRFVPLSSTSIFGYYPVTLICQWVARPVCQCCSVRQYARGPREAQNSFVNELPFHCSLFDDCSWIGLCTEHKLPSELVGAGWQLFWLQGQCYVEWGLCMKLFCSWWRSV